MTAGIGSACNKPTDAVAVQNQAIAVSTQSSNEPQVVASEDNQAASVECSGRRRVHGHHHHCRHHCEDGSVGEVVDDLSRLTRQLGKAQSKIDDAEQGADDLELAQGHAANLTEKIKKVVNSSDFKKADEAVKAVLDAYNADGKEAALEVARENRGVLGHSLMHAIKHGRFGRLERISDAFDTISSIVNPPPVEPEVPALTSEPEQAQSTKVSAVIVKTPVKTAVPTAPVANVDAEEGAAAVGNQAAAPGETGADKPAKLDLSALSKALGNVWRAMGEWRS